MKCARCGTDTVTGPIRYVGEEGLCGLCWHKETGKGVVVTCVECQTRHHFDLGDDVAERLVRESCCDSCDFWRQREAMKDDPRVVRVHGQHYLIGEPFLCFRGFGGQRFIIEFFDGRRVESDCLWTQGIIPPHFRERMPDNARFV
jgi:hypothetical protein